MEPTISPSPIAISNGKDQSSLSARVRHFNLTTFMTHLNPSPIQTLTSTISLQLSHPLSSKLLRSRVTNPSVLIKPKVQMQIQEWWKTRAIWSPKWTKKPTTLVTNPKTTTRIIVHRARKSMISLTMSNSLQKIIKPVGKSSTKVIWRTIAPPHISKSSHPQALVFWSQPTLIVEAVTGRSSKYQWSITRKKIYFIMVKKNPATNNWAKQTITRRQIYYTLIIPSLLLAVTAILFLLPLNSWLSAAIFWNSNQVQNHPSRKTSQMLTPKLLTSEKPNLSPFNLTIMSLSKTKRRRISRTTPIQKLPWLTYWMS